MMFCCVKCFKDEEIKDIIKSNGKIGNCDFCGHQNVITYDLDADSSLADSFNGLLEVYTASADLPENFPKDHVDLLKNILHNQWNIFNVTPDCIYRLITSICREKYTTQPELFDTPVGILENQDEEYLINNSIIKNFHWKDFVDAIKCQNRFHTDHINKDVLYSFAWCMVKPYKAGTVFYRARFCTDENGFSVDKMSAPDPHLASAGRVNSEGISVLYLGDSVKTTLHEIRAGFYDYVCVGKFELLEDIEIINFANIDKISPFISLNMGIEHTKHAINIEHLNMIGQEIAKPLRRHDSVLDYLPTQYVSDFIKSKGFKGIEYASTMCPGGNNLAVFNKKLFECKEVKVYEVKSLSYTYDQII